MFLIYFFYFYPRVPARRLLAVERCLSVACRCSIETAGRIEPVFGSETSFTYFALCFKGIYVATSSWNSVPNSRLLSSLYQFVLTTQRDEGGRSEHDKLDRRRSSAVLSLDSTSDG